MSTGEFARLMDLKRNVLAVYVRRKGFFKQTGRLSKLIKKLEDEVEGCIRDFIVVYDDDEIIVIVDTNQRKDELAFYQLVVLTRDVVEEGGALYEGVTYPSSPAYDPRRIYDDPNYGGYKVAKRRKIIRL